MKLLRTVQGAPGRLIGAIRRHGLAHVLRVMVMLMMGRQVEQVISMLRSVRAARERLAGAIERHGLAHVIGVIAMLLVRRELTKVMRRVQSGRPVGAVASGVGRTRLPGGPEPHLDDAYTLAKDAWANWTRAMPTGAPGRARGTVQVVVRGQARDPAAAAATRAAVLAAGMQVLEPGAAAPAEGLVLFLEAGDLPLPAVEPAVSAAAGGKVEVVSFDLAREVGDRIQPLLLPGANPTLLRAADYLYSRFAVTSSLLAGGDPALADPRALLLGWLEGRSAAGIRAGWRHLGQPLVLARISDSDIAAERERARSRPAGSGRGGPGATVVICTKDKGHLTRQLVRQLLLTPASVVHEVVIVSNGTTNPYALQTLYELSREPRVVIIKDDTPFNFSRLCNAGVRAGQGEGPILLLNDDIAPVSADWLERLAAWLDDPEVGAVGPLLLYPDERVQHAGMYLGFHGIAGHVLRGARLPEEDYLLTAAAPREVSAVTGAVLLTPRKLYQALGGLDEQLATYLQDVDYCLRVRGAGFKCVFEPAAVLIHMESASVKTLLQTQDHGRRFAEHQRFVGRWGDALLEDPFHPRGFDVEDETLRRLAGGGR